MTLQELLNNPGRKVCHLFTLIHRYQSLAVLALVLAGAVLGIILILVTEGAQQSEIEELQAPKAGRGSRGS